MRIGRISAMAAAIGWGLVAPGGETVTTVRSVKIAEGFTDPLYVTAVPGDAARLFVLEQGGFIRIIKNGAVLPTPFLDISADIVAGGELGLLGMAFHPDFATNGLFFLNFTVDGPTFLAPDRTVIARFQLSDNPEIADKASRTDILTFNQPFSNHNGGMMAFGPNDGYLYVASGDGGLRDDPQNNAQQTGTLLGKLLRIDVNGPGLYAIPPENPFASKGGARGEIWAYGLRNPWRFSFDRLTGDLWMGDVGQDDFEELNFQPAGSSGGENYGWKVAEGFACLGGEGTCGTNTGFIPPIYAYPRADGRSVTGGYVYRGEAIPEFQGVYFFADFHSTRIWSFRRSEAGVIFEFTERTVELKAGQGATLNNIASFGEDGLGEMYIVSYSSGEIFRISRPSNIGDVDANGAVNAVDIQLVINAALGLPSTAPTDLNGDAATDAADVQLVINGALGLA